MSVFLFSLFKYYELLKKKFNSMKQDSPQFLDYHSIPPNSFDALRLVFASIVVIAHGMYLCDVELFAPYIKYFDTTVAVMGFFILSGYLILSSALKSDSFSSYLERRAKRLLPGYVTIVLASALLLVFLSDYGFLEYFSESSWWRYLVYNLTFLNFLQPDLPGVFVDNPGGSAVNGSLWTIKIEVAFYLTVPIIVYIMRLLKSKALVISLLSFLYVFSIIYEKIITEMAISRPSLIPLLHQYPAMLQYFSVGMAAYLFCKKVEIFQRPLVILIGVLFFLERYLFGTTYVWPIGLAILIFCIGFTFKNLLKNILKGSDYSYGIYIFHYPIMQTFVALGFFGKGDWWAFVLYLLTIFVIGWLSWHYLEKPFLHKKRHLIR